MPKRYNNHYETILTRSAIRKHTNGIQRPVEPQQDDTNDNDDDNQQPIIRCGDVSLGLKMVIINQKVIIQYVKPYLIDGSPSPATAHTNPHARIQRGDVILSINGSALADALPQEERDVTVINKLILDWLSALHLPNAETGLYEEKVHLELDRSAGLRLIDLWDDSQEKLAEKSAGIRSSNSSSHRRGLFGRRRSSTNNAEEDGYATLEGDDIVVASTNPNPRRRVAGAAAAAGVAGLVLMGPLTAVAAAGGAAYVVHKKRKDGQKQNNSKS